MDERGDPADQRERAAERGDRAGEREARLGERPDAAAERGDLVAERGDPAGVTAGAGAADAQPTHEPGRRRGRRGRDDPAKNMLPGRERRRFGVERFLVRLVATCGVIGIGVVLGAILAHSKVQGWIIGLVIALVSVILSAVLWSSRQL